MKISRIIETKEVIIYLQKRGLTKQYIKAKSYILSGFLRHVDFKLRQPKSSGIWYFRINQQYRALGIIEKDELRILEIDDHQNG